MAVADPVMIKRAQLARMFQGGKVPDPIDVIAVKRDITEAEIARFLRKKLATEPPLTLEQREVLSKLLLAG